MNKSLEPGNGDNPLQVVGPGVEAEEGVVERSDFPLTMLALASRLVFPQITA